MSFDRFKQEIYHMSKKRIKKSNKLLESDKESEDMAVIAIGEDQVEEFSPSIQEVVLQNINTEIVKTIETENQNTQIVEQKPEFEIQAPKVIDESQEIVEEKAEKIKIIEENKMEIVEVKTVEVEKVTVTEVTTQIEEIVIQSAPMVEEKIQVKEEIVLETNESVAEKKVALEGAKQKFQDAVARSLDEELAKVENMEVISSQFNKSSDFIQSMLIRLEEHLEIAGAKGRTKIENVVDGVLGDNIINDIATKTLGYVGEKVAQGYTLGTAPAVAVTGAVRGVYRTIVE
jgi:hypothetical protein